MKKLTFVFILLFSLAGTVMAQDTITTKEGKDIKAKVIEINPTEIKYLDFENLEGPVYVLNKSDILLIRYENGKNEVFTNQSNAQDNTHTPKTSPYVTEGMRYKDYKMFYDPHQYSRQFGDPYNPTLAGVASFFIPGLGQGLCDEWGRGLAIFGGNILGSYGLIATTVASTIYMGPGDSVNISLTGFVIGCSLLTAYNIWNIVDAVHVAKIKNMYHQDIHGRQASFKLSLSPCVTYINTPNTTAPAMGLSLNLGF
jgi:hypothetical protein